MIGCTFSSNGLLSKHRRLDHSWIECLYCVGEFIVLASLSSSIDSTKISTNFRIAESARGGFSYPDQTGEHTDSRLLRRRFHQLMSGALPLCIGET